MFCSTFNFLAGYTKLMVIGGFNDGDLRSVEVIDLENPSSSCNAISDYPIADKGMAVGLINNIIKSCGSEFDTDSCYDYNPSTNTWSTGIDMLSARQNPRASLIDNVWLVSGDSYETTTEFWTGSNFEYGPDLPTLMFLHCQLTINSTHVFFAEDNNKPAYLLDWTTQSWTELPNMNEDRDWPSCGLINNPENGLEVVIVEDGTTEIFNLNDLTWRSGPSVTEFDEGSYAQIGDTFVVVGGQDYYGDALDTIYKFDHLNYEWILLDQRLQTPRESYPGVVAVPDEFVTCG